MTSNCGGRGQKKVSWTLKERECQPKRMFETDASFVMDAFLVTVTVDV